MYEKVSEEVAQVTAEPSAEYREVKRWAEKGERIRIVSKHDGRYENRDEFVVDAPAGFGDVFVKHPQGMNEGRACVCYVEYVVLEPIAQPVVYVEVKRKADVGERIRIVNACAWSDYENGDEFNVVRLDSDGDIFIVDNAGGPECVATDEYVVLEPVTAQVIEEPERLTVGDYVKVVREGGTHNYAVGSVVKVTKLDGFGLFNAERADGKIGNLLALGQTEPATEAEFLAQRKPAFNVGDKIRITRSQCNWPVGTIATVTEVLARLNHDSGTVKALADGHTYLADGCAFEVLTAEEVAAAEKEAALALQEIAKWNAIGRKVGEYKTGDIVEVTSTSGLCVGDKINVGDIVVLGDKDESDEMFRLQAPGVIGGNWAETDMFKLVTPVEQRFDDAA
ncbi:hypothetical protein [Paenibacillus sp. FSL R7-269]|uniref:hypothetical protein n=1 Tax=Paenibacillus sp. FSL R7-269 TaxID=1226755 RepID=UPI0012EC203A|nr:hypothetical protein [Paenibacillus sp. FSL R7-269]